MKKSLSYLSLNRPDAAAVDCYPRCFQRFRVGLTVAPQVQYFTVNGLPDLLGAGRSNGSLVLIFHTRAILDITIVLQLIYHE